MKIKKFNEHTNKSILIDGETYIIKKSHLDFDKFDEDGCSKEYPPISYVVIEKKYPGDRYQEPRVRIFDGIFDDNNHRNAFDPMNYSEENIVIRLKYGDECGPDELYDIVSTTNKSGNVNYDYLNKNIIHDDLKNKIIN